jgi:hypothetical protein
VLCCTCQRLGDAPSSRRPAPRLYVCWSCVQMARWLGLDFLYTISTLTVQRTTSARCLPIGLLA